MGECQIRMHFQVQAVEWYAEVGNLGCAALAVSFSDFTLVTIWLLLYRLNCHYDKQPVVGNLFFAELWIAGNSRQDEQITP